MSQIIVSDLTPSTTEPKIKEFFTICGPVTHVALNTPSPNSATVSFETEDAAETAVLFSGACIVDGPVTITAVVQQQQHQSEASTSSASSPARSALDVANAIAAKGYIKGEALVGAIRERAKAVDLTRAKKLVGLGSKGAGAPITGQWMYRNLQPQWGAAPTW
eukprot:PhF_6_TR41666/c0_g1_i1/m.63165